MLHFAEFAAFIYFVVVVVLVLFSHFLLIHFTKKSESGKRKWVARSGKWEVASHEQQIVDTSL